MGFLTTITIRNDFLHEIERNPQEFTTKIVQMCHRMKGDPEIYWGSDMIPQHTRHADDHTCFIHMGNTVVEMNPYEKETKRIAKEHPEFFNKLLAFMINEVKELKKLKNISSTP